MVHGIDFLGRKQVIVPQSTNININYGGGFNEIDTVNSQILVRPDKNFSATFDFRAEKNIEGLRFDPYDNKNALSIKIFKITVNGELVEDFSSNAFQVVDEYFNFHADDIKKILIKHAQKTFELPFVNGITLEMFGKLLREKNIIGKSTSATSVAKKNFLDVRNGKVFLCDEERLVELYAEATGDFAAYFDQHTAKNIFVKHNGNLFEIPFADGMSLALFDKILREKKIIGRNSSGKKIAAQSLLDVRNKRVFLLTEDELSIAQDDLETDVDGFFNEHALEIKSISIRHDGKIFDLPFVNGMPLKVFGKLLRERKIIDRKISAKEIIVSNRLELRNEKIFIRELI